MRCPSCGTQNEPDSRFCGGCGARLSGVENRLAPTQKIETGGQPIQPAPAGMQVSAPIGQRGPSAERSAQRANPQPQPYPVAPSVERKASAPQPAQHPSAPQSAQRGAASLPPQNSRNGAGPANSFQTTTPKPRPELDGSIGLPRRRPVALIAVVLLIDVGLAAAGAWMLSRGLGASEPAASGSAPGSGSAAVQGGSAQGLVTPIVEPIATGSAAAGEAASAAPSDPALQVDAVAGSVAETRDVPPAGSASLIAREQPADPPAKAAAQSRKKKKATKKTTTTAKPLDPYDDEPPPPPDDQFQPPPPPPPLPGQ